MVLTHHHTRQQWYWPARLRYCWIAYTASTFRPAYFSWVCFLGTVVKEDNLIITLVLLVHHILSSLKRFVCSHVTSHSTCMILWLWIPCRGPEKICDFYAESKKNIIYDDDKKWRQCPQLCQSQMKGGPKEGKSLNYFGLKRPLYSCTRFLWINWNHACWAVS